MEVTAPIERDSHEGSDDSLWEDTSDSEVEEEQDVAWSDTSTTQSYVIIRRKHERIHRKKGRDKSTSLTTRVHTNVCVRRDIDTKRNRASHFMHPPIDFVHRQIRLVRIVPSEVSSPIECEFVLGLVDNPAEPYTALSYTWGSAGMASDIVNIIVGGQYFWIRWNLWDFLHRARMDRSLCQRLFWIDAICIDQAGNGINGLQEKNHQVNMMKEIYSNACEVISWLGEPTSHSGRRQELEDLQKYLISETSLIQEDSALKGLYYIGRCDYWSRIWIIQELVLAQKVIVKFGDYSFNWHNICELWEDQYYAEWGGLTTKDSQGRPAYNSEIHVPFARNVCWRNAWPIIRWYMSKSTQKCSIIDALLAFQQQACSSPLDKIYGLLGLVEDEPVLADYNKTAVQLFEDLIVYSRQYIMDEGDVSERRYDVVMSEFLDRLEIALGLSYEEKKEVRARLGMRRL